MNKRKKLDQNKLLPSFAVFKGILGTFLLTMLTDVIFRTRNVTEAFHFYARLFSGSIARYPSTKPKREKVNMFAQYIMDYATHLQQEGKNVYFIVGPRELTFVKYGLAQKRILVQHGFKVFDLSDPKLYPQFYSYDYSFDLLHLNYEGAVLYTQTLANLLKESNGQK